MNETLGKIREWIKWHALNGSSVTWGSDDKMLFTRPLTVKDLEDLAIELSEDPTPIKTKQEQKYIAMGKAFETLTKMQRIRNLGSAKIGSHKYQHAGYEFWTSYGMPEDQEELAPMFLKEKKQGLEVLYTMLIAFDGGGEDIDEDKHDLPKASTIEDLIKHFSKEEK